MAELAILGGYIVYGGLYILRERIIARHMTPTREK
jgi:hypothetical protein